MTLTPSRAILAPMLIAAECALAVLLVRLLAWRGAEVVLALGIVVLEAVVIYAFARWLARRLDILPRSRVREIARRWRARHSVRIPRPVPRRRG